MTRHRLPPPSHATACLRPVPPSDATVRLRAMPPHLRATPSRLPATSRCAPPTDANVTREHCAPPTGSGLGYDRVEHYTRARRRGRANVTTARTAMPANAEKDRPAAPSCRPRRGSSARQAEKFETQLAGIKRLQLAQHAMAAAWQAAARQAALLTYLRARSPDVRPKLVDLLAHRARAHVLSRAADARRGCAQSASG